MKKPSRCQQLVSFGLVLLLIGAIGLASSIPAALSVYSGGALEGLALLSAAALIGGLVFLLVGISRATAAIDYLVAISEAPESPERVPSQQPSTSL